LHHAPPGDKLDVVGVINRACLMADALGFEAVRSQAPLSFDEVVQSLPETDRRRFRHTAETLGIVLRARIQSLE
ncbi:MAG: hypothetical protein ACRD1N_05955, partial [Terriglobia bacterium]